MAKSFVKNETRELTLDAGKIDPQYLIEGKALKVTAKQVEVVHEDWGEGRLYEVVTPTGTMQIQLNHGVSENDELRLATFVEECLRETDD